MVAIIALHLSLLLMSPAFPGCKGKRELDTVFDITAGWCGPYLSL